jgi:hypothetical protein
MVKKRISETTARKLARDLGVNLRVVKIAWWKRGVEHEFEHGKRNSLTNVTNDDLTTTAKIALAHFIEEGPYYYEFLHCAEKRMKEEWDANGKKSVLRK